LSFAQHSEKEAFET